jgi:histidinol-phosphate aminotransferase
MNVPDYTDADIRDRGVRVRMHRNESPLAPPPFVLDAVRTAAPDVLRNYPSELAAEVRALLAARFGVREETVLLTNGADEALGAVARAFATREARMIAAEPTFGMYDRVARIAGLNPWRIPYRERWRFDVDAVAQAAGRGDLVILGHPNNPTGDTLDRDAVVRLAKALPQSLIAIDEVYLAFSERSLVDLARLLPNVVVIGSLSKIASLAGMRVGYAVADPQRITQLRAVVQPFPVAGLSLVAARAYLMGGEQTTCFEAELRTRVRQSLDAIDMAIQPFARERWRGPANFILADLGDRRDAIVAALRRDGIAIRTYGVPLATYARFCAVDEDGTAAFVNAVRTLEVDGVPA